MAEACPRALCRFKDDVDSVEFPDAYALFRLRRSANDRVIRRRRSFRTGRRRYSGLGIESRMVHALAGHSH